MVTSSATVTPFAFATNQPSISCELMITSASAKIVLFSLIKTDICPSFSKVAICCWSKAEMAAATAFISFPKRGPSALKSGFICFTSMPEPSSISSISFTFTSLLINSETAKISSFSESSKTGIIIFWSGWRTFIFSFCRNESTSDDIVCAFCILCSNFLSMNDASAFGKSVKCTDSIPSFEVPAVKSL